MSGYGEVRGDVDASTATGRDAGEATTDGPEIPPAQITVSVATVDPSDRVAELASTEATATPNVTFTPISVSLPRA